MSIEDNLRVMEVSREAYWRAYPNSSPVKLRWRALTVRHSFHILPAETILELGSGSGLWTEHLTTVLRGENPITAAVFNEKFAKEAPKLPNVQFVTVTDLETQFPVNSFDYIVGTAIICHDLYPQTLAVLQKLLKPGGQLLFFESNYWNPQVFLKNHIPIVRKMSNHPPCQIGMRRYQLMRIASQQGFVNLEIVPYDIIHPWTPRPLIPILQSVAFLLEHAPLVSELCGTLYIWGKKPGDEQERRPKVNLATRPELKNAVSFVVPCYNEEATIPGLVKALTQSYNDYIHEIVLVDDNSKDNTYAVASAMKEIDPRVKVVKRTPPGGVGRALRDGYKAATGQYIMSLDADFIQVIPELRDMFDAVADGYEGAIGSRFSHDSVMWNYPFIKLLCNRSFHLLMNILLNLRVRDISNNLKIYRADILKNLDLEQDGFAANVETGLKPVLRGYKVKEVPISWINRTIDMGSSSFAIPNVASGYFNALMRIVKQHWQNPSPKSINSSAVIGDTRAGSHAE